jgi:outer membrane receptor for Fe3+-dicitrate
MKKIVATLIFILAFALVGFSQNVISSSGNNTQSFSNEIKVNFLNLIVLGSIEVGYERFLGDDHSLDLQVHINDRFGFNSQEDGKNYKTNSVQAAMNFYFGNNSDGRFFIYPMAKLRFGDFEEMIDGSNVNTNMNAFILGAGIGYKWEFSKNFAFGPYASIARGFSSKVSERFTSVELNGGFSLGYRF